MLNLSSLPDMWFTDMDSYNEFINGSKYVPNWEASKGRVHDQSVYFDEVPPLTADVAVHPAIGKHRDDVGKRYAGPAAAEVPKDPLVDVIGGMATAMKECFGHLAASLSSAMVPNVVQVVFERKDSADDNVSAPQIMVGDKTVADVMNEALALDQHDNIVFGVLPPGEEWMLRLQRHDSAERYTLFSAYVAARSSFVLVAEPFAKKGQTMVFTVCKKRTTA